MSGNINKEEVFVEAVSAETLYEDNVKVEDYYKNNIPKNIHTYGDVHLSNVTGLAQLLMKLHIIKSKTYKGSWAARGHTGIFFTMVRPLDRIENIHDTVINTGSYKELFTRTFFDALVDTALYCIKWATIISDMQPSILESWMKENELSE